MTLLSPALAPIKSSAETVMTSLSLALALIKSIAETVMTAFSGGAGRTPASTASWCSNARDNLDGVSDGSFPFTSSGGSTDRIGSEAVYLSLPSSHKVTRCQAWLIGLTHKLLPNNKPRLTPFRLHKLPPLRRITGGCRTDESDAAALHWYFPWSKIDDCLRPTSLPATQRG